MSQNSGRVTNRLYQRPRITAVLFASVLLVVSAGLFGITLADVAAVLPTIPPIWIALLLNAYLGYRLVRAIEDVASTLRRMSN